MCHVQDFERSTSVLKVLFLLLSIVVERFVQNNMYFGRLLCLSQRESVPRIQIQTCYHEKLSCAKPLKVGQVLPWMS